MYGDNSDDLYSYTSTLPLLGCNDVRVYSLVWNLIFTTALQIGDFEVKHVFSKIFLHVCVHLMGMHIFLMSQVRNRSTFLKVLESVIAQDMHKKEKEIIDATIHSLMPDIIAIELLREGRVQPRCRPPAAGVARRASSDPSTWTAWRTSASCTPTSPDSPRWVPTRAPSSLWVSSTTSLAASTTSACATTARRSARWATATTACLVAP